MQGLDLSLYGLNYLLGFILLLFFNRKVYKSTIYNLLIVTYMSIFTIIGGRLGYVFFYEFSYYKVNLGEILELYKGGMAFHGAILAIFIGAFILDRHNALSILDNCIKVALICIPFGRICSFLNGELYGRITDNTLIGVIFTSVDNNLRYPSQLIEALLEGVVLAFILFFIYKKRLLKGPGFLCAYFGIFYSILRFIAEFTREADVFLGYVWNSYSMGQVLSIFMLVSSVAFFKLLDYRYKKQKSKNALNSELLS